MVPHWGMRKLRFWSIQFYLTGLKFAPGSLSPCNYGLSASKLNVLLVWGQRKPSEVAALFTIAKTWRQSTCPSTDECINKMCMYNGILLSHKKEWNNAICSNMDRPRDYHTKWSKSEKEKYHITSLICGILNVTQMYLSTEQKQTQRHREYTCDWQREAGRGGTGWEFGVRRCKLLYGVAKS